MKKLYITFLFLIASISFTYTQVDFYADCCNAIELTSSASWTVPGLAGPGALLEPLSDCSCLTQDETNTYWFKFDCTEDSPLAFAVRSISGGGDYDFALFKDECPCSAGSLGAVACDNTDAPGPPPLGPTGMGNPAQFGYPGVPQFQPSIQMTTGETYFLVVDNKLNTEGFVIQFGADTKIGQVPHPGPTPLTGPTSLCPGSSGSFMVPPGSLGDLFRWLVIPSFGPPISETSHILEWDFDDPGSYEICVSEVNPPCFDPAGFTCITVDVSPIPITAISDVICYPGPPYYADNGEEFFNPGVYTLEFESYLGCDSTVILTLDAAPSDLEIRTAFACDGDCVEFEGEMVCEEGLFEKIYTNQFGCDSTISLNLITIPLEIEVTGEDTLTCHTTSLFLDASMSLVGGDETTFLWKNPAGDTLDTDSILFVTAPGTYTIQVTTILDDEICVEEKKIVIIADTAPPADVTATGGSLSCTINSVVLMGNTSTPNVNYLWSGPNNFSSDLQNPTVTTTGSYILTVTGENGCETVEAAEVVEVLEILTANASGGTIDCYSANVTLNGNSPGFGISYAWEGPNNTTYVGPNPSVGLSGNYTLTVTDFNGCTGTAQTVVLEDIAKPVAVANANQVLTCNNNSVFLSGNGSSFGPQFTYLWTTNNGNITSGETTLNPTVNIAGTYTLKVTNNTNGCTKLAQTTVIESPDVTAAISGQANVTCFGGNNGSATAAGGGGNDIYTYNWSNGMMGNTINNVSEGSYIVTVSDGNDCTATSSVTITQPTPLLANTAATPQSMPGVNDGIAAVTPSGGTPGYTLMWSTGSSSPIISGLAPGNYTVTVTDANECQTIGTVTVNGILCFGTATIARIDESCDGFEDGQATINLTNATDPVSYIWSNDETTQTITGLAPGNYSVTATDANDCELVASVTITGPAALNANATSTDQVVPGMNDGTATANPTGGTSPYTYLWSTDDTSASISGLAPGDYEVTVTDANDCIATQVVTVEVIDCGVLLNIDFTNASCNGADDGLASVLPTGGLAPFVFNWSNDETTPTIGNLPAGTYDVTVTDASQCPAFGQVIISEPDLLILETTNVTPAACGSDNGTATVMAGGGTPDYDYLWPNGETTPTVENLAEGIYTVAATDANNCMTILDVEIETDITTDIEPPVAIATDFTIELDQNGSATITTMDVDNGSSDNCGISSIELDITSFDCGQVGENTVTLTITDVGGNTDTAIATVTVEDNIPPVINDCPSNMALPYCEPVATFNLSATDNCSTDLPLDQTSGLPSGSTFPAGETTVQTYQATDVGGNTVTCTFEITVAETMSIDTTVTDVSCFGENNGSIETTVTGGSPDYTYLWSNDSTSMSINDIGPGMYSLTITDSGGCEVVQEFEVEEPEDLVTTLVNIINEINNMGDGAVDVTVGGGVMPYTYEWTDLVGNVVGTMEDISGLPAGTYQLFVEDANGCVSSSAYTIQNIPTATNNPDLSALVNIFPNPTAGWLTVEFTGIPVTEMDISVHDVIGQLAFDQIRAKVNGGKYLLNLSEFPEGVYLIKLTIEGQVVTKRIVRVD